MGGREYHRLELYGQSDCAAQDKRPAPGYPSTGLYFKNAGPRPVYPYTDAKILAEDRHGRNG